MTDTLPALVASGVELQKAGELTAAIEQYERALQIRPTNGAALYGLATCLHLLGHYEDALHAYEAASPAFPDHPAIATRKAHLNRQLGRLHLSIEQYERARQLDASDPTIGIGAAQALSLLGEQERALLALDLQEESSGPSASIAIQRGRTLVALGRFSEARELADSIIVTSPDEALAKALLLTDVASADWDLIRAETEIAKACAAQPENPTLHLRHAARLLALLRPLDAMTALAARADAVSSHGRSDIRPRATQGLFADIANEFLLDPRSLGAARVALESNDPEWSARVVRESPGSLAAASGMFVTLRRSGRLGEAGVGDSTIPRHVVQAWLGSPLPAELHDFVSTWRRIPDWRYTRFDDSTAHAFLGSEIGPDAARAFLRARHPAARADLVRLAWLAVRGGVWADTDDARRGALEPLLDGRSLVVWQEDRGNLANDFMAAAPGHPAIISALDECVRNLLDTYTESTWLATGPGLVTRAVGSWLAAHLDEAGRSVAILDRHELGRAVVPGLPLPYKSTPNYWLHAEAGA